MVTSRMLAAALMVLSSLLHLANLHAYARQGHALKDCSREDMMDSITIGIVGAGNMARGNGTRFASQPGVRIGGIVDVDPERAAALAGHFQTRAHTRIDALLEDDSIDAVYIAAPNRFHADYSRRALLAGKHVLVEKPFACHADEAMSVVAVAAEVGRTLMVGMNRRFPHVAQKAKRLIADGALGRIYRVEARWLRSMGIPQGRPWFCSRQDAGGGCLYDIGVHMLDLAMHLAGCFEPVRVSGSTSSIFVPRVYPTGDVEDHASALITLAPDVLIDLEVSWARHRSTPTEEILRVYGEQGTLSLYPYQIERCEVTTNSNIVSTFPAGPTCGISDTVAAHFIAVLRKQEDPFVLPEEALAVQRTLDAIYESAANGCDVHLSNQDTREAGCP